MNFIHPGLLIGFAACAIPIIIHLLFRRRFQRLKWAAMKFLLAAYKKTKTTLLIEHILLLLLRILMIAVLVLIFAVLQGLNFLMKKKKNWKNGLTKGTMEI